MEDGEIEEDKEEGDHQRCKPSISCKSWRPGALIMNKTAFSSSLGVLKSELAIVLCKLTLM